MTTPPEIESRRPGGRRSKLTPETHDAIVRAVRAGATHEAAAGAAGIDESTLYRWLREAEAEDAPADKRQFHQDLARARAEVEVRVVAGSVMRGIMGGYELEKTTLTRPDGTVEERVRYAPADPRTGLEFLARREPSRWGRRNPVEISGPGGGPVLVQTAVIHELSARLFEELTADDDVEIEAEVLSEEEGE